jgi:hypothetical protein
MSAQQPEDNLNELAGAAKDSIRQQQEKADALAAVRPRPSMARQIVTALLVLAFVAVAWVQYPRVHEPFGRPDPNQEPAVAEADLTILATLIQSYRLAQGKYPTSLDQVRLPDGLAAFVAEQKIAYRQTDSAYVLEWTLPRWRAVLDGESGKVDITPVKDGK